jgi:hypothetical protein
LGFLLAGNTEQMADTAFVAELKSWIRFSYDDAVSTRDGLFSKTSGAPALPDWLGRFAFPLILTKDAENRKYTSELRSSSGVAVFVSERNEPAGWIEAGRCCQRFALQTTALNLQHSFINQPVEIPAVRGQLATYLGVAGRRPDLIMRFGHGPALPRSLRRPTSQVTRGA